MRLYFKVLTRGYNNEDDFCMVIRTNQKLLLSENKKVSILVDKEMGLEAAIFRGPAKWCRKSLRWVKLSNSGDILKLLVPNSSFQTIGSLNSSSNSNSLIITTTATATVTDTATIWWNAHHNFCKLNRLCKVTNQKMTEREIDYRGSKSIIAVCPIHTFAIIVKEQRVDGSWWEKFKNATPIAPKGFFHLRCTLMGFERNCSKGLFLSKKHFIHKLPFGSVSVAVKRVLLLERKLSNQNPFLANIKLIGFEYKQQLLHFNRGISNTSFKDKHIQAMNAWWLTGFVDAEGCFRLSILANKNYKEGGKVLPFKPRLYFQIGLHRKDVVILESIKSLLGGGGRRNLQISIWFIRV